LDALAGISADLRAPLDVVDGSVRVLADIAKNDVAKFAASARALPSRPIPGDAPGCPRPVGALAAASAEGKFGPQTEVSSFEKAIFFGALGRAAGKTPNYAYIRGAPYSASELLARTFAVRFDGAGPYEVFTANVGGAAGPTTIAEGDPELTPLGGKDLVAMQIAYKAMGQAAAGKHDEASRLAGIARQLRPEDPALLFLIARIEFATGLGSVAQRTFDKAVGLERDAMTDYLLGRLARIDGRPVDAVSAFTRAADTAPTFGEPWVELAELSLERLDVTPRDQHADLLKEARLRANAARKANPKAQGLRLVEGHLAALGVDDQGAVSADNTEEAGRARHTAAVALLNEETEINPQLENAWMLLAQVYASVDDDASAIAALERARAMGRETGELANALGQLLAGSSGRFDDALAAFERALILSPDIVELRPQIAQIRRQKGDIERARQLMQEQLAKFPDDRISTLLLAQLELDEKKTAVALKLLDGLLKRDPKDADANVLRYIGQRIAGQDGVAARDAAVEAAGGLRKLAEILLQQGMHPEAEPLLVEGLEVEKDDLIIPVLLVALQTASGRLQEAAALRATTLAALEGEDRAQMEELFDEAIKEALKSAMKAGGNTPGATTPPGETTP